MFDIMDASGISNAAYFVFLVFVGAYFVINLVIAVIYQSYIDTIDQAQAKKNANSATAEATAKHRRHKRDTIPSLVCMMYDQYIAPEFLYEFLTSNPTYSALKLNIKKIVNSTQFHWVIVFLILLNIIVLAMEANGVKGDIQDFTNNANFIFTICFVVELVLRIIATDITKFFVVPFNVLDSAIVVVSVSEFFYHGASSALSSFRTLRVFRTFKLLNRWESLQQLVYAVFKSGPGLGYFCIILFLYIFICALAGMSLFAGKMDNDTLTFGTPRTNYDTLFIALVTTFQIVSGENWNDVMFRAMEVNETLGGVYFVIVYGLGNLIVLNLFLAILLENFSEGRYRKDKMSYYEQLDHQRDVQVVVSTLWTTLAALLKRKVWLMCGYTLCQKMLPVDWEGKDGSDVSKTGSDVGGSYGEIGAVDILQGESDEEQEEEGGSMMSRTITYFLGRKSRSSVSSVGSRRNSASSVVSGTGDGVEGDDDRSPVKKSMSLWEGWDQDGEIPLSSMAQDLLQNDAARRLVLGDIVLGQYRRGNQYFNDCFMGVELVDMLLDRGIVNHVAEGVRVGQELLTRRKLLAVHIQYEDTNDDDEISISTPTSHVTPVAELKQQFVTSRKITANVETRFLDDRTLYRLSDQGEQVTEWLMTSKAAERTMIEHKAQIKMEQLRAMLADKSFGLFGSNNKLRKLCASIVIHKYFELFVVAMIIASR